VPELPDIALYVAALEARVVGRTLHAVRVNGPAWLRSVDPPLSAASGRRVVGVSRIGKRIAIALEGDLFLVLHLMIAGRLQWKPGPARAPAGLPRRGKELGSFEFESGTLVATEAGTRKRATLQLVRGADALAAIDPGGLEPLTASRDEFAARLRARNHTVKRALTDPHVFSGIGNAYSDEILHAARLSPFKQTQKLGEEEVDRLYAATQATLTAWVDRLRTETGDEWPAKVTAFRPEMAVHGRYREPCPVCGAPVQRITYAENEANYCARCQTEGKLLADRALSRLLHDDWPKTLEELEERRPAAMQPAPAKSAKPRRRR
jgi:formamidopyrimidine-DNA glycosylase